MSKEVKVAVVTYAKPRVAEEKLKIAKIRTKYPQTSHLSVIFLGSKIKKEWPLSSWSEVTRPECEAHN